MASPGQVMLAIGLSLCLPAAWADGSEACRVDGSCEAVQGASMLQAKSQRGKMVLVQEDAESGKVVKETRTWKQAHARHRKRAFMHKGKLMTPYGGNWVVGAFGHCTQGCTPPVKERSVECKDFWDGNLSHACPHLKPATTVTCSCTLETCVDTPLSNCTATGNVHPSKPGAPSTAHYTLAGCFDLDSGDSTAAGDFMDTTCMNYSGPGKCRSGLPFFRNTTATTAPACATFCLGKGLDIFGLVSQAECRCGASSLNEEVWHGGTAPAHLAFDGYALTANDEADLCPLEVYHYTGHFDMGGVPLSLLKTFADTSAYIDSVVAGHTISPDEEPPPGAGLLQRSDPWDVSCYPSLCGAGGSAWTDRRSEGPTGDASVDKFNEYVWVPYVMTSNIDDVRRESFEAAVKMWTDSTCIVPYEVASDPGINFITVDVVTESSCYSSGLGLYSGTINLGWCKDAIHIGNMAHEIGHSLGMLHEQSRMDAAQEYHGEGPYLTILWQNIDAGWQSQYLPSASEYLGSADDGSGDLYSGYAPYDFGSLMHYPGGDAFDTVDGVSEALVGQRSHLAGSDIMQALDMYACTLKDGFELSPTPAPAHIITISGACDQNGFDMNGAYASQGVTDSGATWYLMSGGLALYFDPSCDGGSSGPGWFLDNSYPDTAASSDLDLDGVCAHWGKVNTAVGQLSVPEAETWTIYCPFDGGDTDLVLTIAGVVSATPAPPTPPTPAPPTEAPTPAPPTTAPTPAPTTPLPACVGDSSTFNAGYGGCDTYYSGSSNYNYCNCDFSCPYFASDVCPGCGACEVGPTPAPTFPVPTPALPDCVGDSSSFNAGYGGCETYQYGMCNHGWCAWDKMNGVSAADTCPQCLSCTEVAAVPTPAPTSTPAVTATLLGEDMKCTSGFKGWFKKVEYDDCMQACVETSGCTAFSYKPLNTGTNAPGVCRIGTCTNSKTVNNWESYELD